MIRKTILAAAIAAVALHVQAADVVINFSSTPFDDGSLGGKVLTGQFVYDDTTLFTDPVWNTMLAPVKSLSFMLNGQAYSVTGTELAASAVTFNGSAVAGVEMVASFGTGYSLVTASPVGDFPAFTYYANGDFSDQGAATLSFAPVPEPESYALMLGGLGVIGWIARRRKA
ncbi:FxDxF family PEP-CTERM protein [Pelomonas cellulosilytica]|uniref:FxDxF family PEP-CTERM protein n=1 Tax=Pelomonas cellulosilytica TaxID=2906762 RepID=A0ABS8XUG6_9BURK|nr:FxDxF family PEP-CTERM protein [Pelomonas sp. P8]MCE4556331.1 FxDxF family PEP-CTERM protein [Pelomonas sp. P8]